MAEQSDVAVNSGEQISDTSTNLPVSQEAQFRILNQRLDALTTQMGQLAKPPQFRVAEVLSLLVIVTGLIVAGFTAFGLSERITDVGTRQAEAERRLEASRGAMEIRLGTKLDKLSDQFSAMGERTSRLEGEIATKSTKAR